MCGIAGMLSPRESNNYDAVIEMARTLDHRGPDERGAWYDPANGIALSHTRLSIIDLSPQGNQPMISHSGRYVLVYNGEIYNFQHIRRELEKQGDITWRGHSDTEVLITAIEKWGLQKVLDQSDGMFAFALWDKKHQRLTFVRDRVGEKPLYIGWLGGNIVFASEMKAFHKLPQWHRDINRKSLGYLLRFGYVPAPLSIYEGIYKLFPGHSITLESDDCQTVPAVEDFMNRCKCYWNLPAHASSAVERSSDMDPSMAIDRLERLLTESIRLRMVADVPIGALLSGGIDSSIVTAIMQRISPKPVKTFTIGFSESELDEARHAKSVAAHIGSDHTEIFLSHRDALDLITRLPEIYDEPFADPSQIPTVLVSRVARQKVTVALSGDGGDELFSGYARYWAGLRIWPVIKWLPSVLRLKIGQLLASGSKSVAQSMFQYNPNKITHRIWRLGRRVSAEDFESFYANLQSLSLCQTAASSWPTGLPLVRRTETPLSAMNIEQRMMLFDQCSYLPDDILVKTDRASMSASLELRVPLLDHKLVEFAWSLPSHLRRKGENGKQLLRQLLYRYVPRKLVERPKKGFEIPQDKWLRGPLREWMLDLLAPSSILKDGYLDNTVIQWLVSEHLSGHGDHGYALWPTLMFQAWLAEQ